MAKINIKPLCKDKFNSIVQRCEQQLLEAYPVLAQIGRTHSYTAINSENRQQQWQDCISSMGIVLRKNDRGRLVYHYKQETWLPIEYCPDLKALCECADFLLGLALEHQKQPTHNEI